MQNRIGTTPSLDQDDRSLPTDRIDDECALIIGARTLPSRFFLAPLAGYTQLAFRTAIRELGGLGLATTDLVQSSFLLSGNRRARQLIVTSLVDRPLSVQIYGGVAEELVQAAQWLTTRGYESIDINMGCPMAKITGKGGGARMMCDLEIARDTVARVVDAVDVPVTVKMRLGWDRDSITAPQLAREFEKVGVVAITVHGRTRQQGFGGSVNLDGIRDTVQAVERIPIIGNGDVLTVDDALEMRRKTGCAAVAIGRGAMLDPWIFRKLEQHSRDHQSGGCAALRPQPPDDPTELIEPTDDEQIEFLTRHFTLMTEQHGDYSCVLFRKFAAWYGARLGIPEDLEDRLRRFGDFAEFEEIVEQIRRRRGERKTTVPTALVKVPNGPVERW